MVASAVPGCASSLQTEIYREPDAMVPAFAAPSLAAHLAMMGGVADRSTGSPGLAAASTYAATVFTAAGLQPLVAGDFRVLSFGPLARATDARLERRGRDTLRVTVSTSMEPDGRSDRGTARTRTVWFVDPGAMSGRPPDRALAPVAVVSARDSATATLKEFRESGVRVILEVVDDVSRVAPRSIEDMLIVRVDTAAVLRLLPGSAVQGGAVAAAARMLRGDRGALPAAGSVLPLDLFTEVVSDFDPAAPAVNVYGLVPGRDPVLRSELLVVGAGLDHPGNTSGVDPGTDILGAAAVVEAARVLAGMADAGDFPQRSVLFALWAGSRQGGTGLRSWMVNPGWARDAIRDVLVVEGSIPTDDRSDPLPIRRLDMPDLPRNGRPAINAARIAREILLEIAPRLWERDGPSRVPGIPDP